MSCAAAIPAIPASPVSVPAFRPDGTVMDLANIQASDIDFVEMADRLSRLPRWCGRVAAGDMHPISIAQHSVMGAEALRARFGCNRIAAAFLLHDAHEYLIGDIVTPTAQLIAASANLSDAYLVLGETDHIVRDAITRAKRTIDTAIFAAAGMPDWLDLFRLDQKTVAAMDRQMMLVEGVALFGPAAAKHLPAPPRGTTLPKEAVRGWGPEKARERFVARLNDYLGLDVRRSA